MYVQGVALLKFEETPDKRSARYYSDRAGQPGTIVIGHDRLRIRQMIQQDRPSLFVMRKLKNIVEVCGSTYEHVCLFFNNIPGTFNLLRLNFNRIMFITP